MDIYHLKLQFDFPILKRCILLLWNRRGRKCLFAINVYRRNVCICYSVLWLYSDINSDNITENWLGFKQKDHQITHRHTRDFRRKKKRICGKCFTCLQPQQKQLCDFISHEAISSSVCDRSPRLRIQPRPRKSLVYKLTVPSTWMSCCERFRGFFAGSYMFPMGRSSHFAASWQPCCT